MMKKMKRVAVESCPSYAACDEEAAKNKFRHQSLLQDFRELEKETEVAKKRLLTAKQKKLRLLAEVKFLQQRYKYLLKNPSQKISAEHHVQPQIRNKSSLYGRNKSSLYSEKEASIKSPPGIDLNQICLPNGEEREEVQIAWEPLRMDKKPKRFSMEQDALAGDLKLSVCRDVGIGRIGNGSTRSGKRKISWQDQVALRV